MPSFVDVLNGADAAASTIQQVVDSLKGTAGKGIPLSPTAVNDPINFALAVKNNDAGASKAFIVYKADGTVLFQVDKNGVIASPDGTLGASQIATLTGSQTLTNKTLTAPNVTGGAIVAGATSDNTTNALQARNLASNNLLTVRDDGLVTVNGAALAAGGLTVTAGPLSMGAAASQIIPGATSLSIRDTANANDNLLVSNAGLATVRGGLVVSAGGAIVSGTTSDNTTNALQARNLAATNLFTVRSDGLVTVNAASLGSPAGLTVTAGATTLGGDLKHNGGNLSFFSTALSAKYTVTGSKAGNAALASLMAGLAQYGLFTDSTT